MHVLVGGKVLFQMVQEAGKFAAAMSLLTGANPALPQAGKSLHSATCQLIRNLYGSDWA
jgi:cellulase/cellobiase CelA1